MDRQKLVAGYKRVVGHIYEPEVFYRRARKTIARRLTESKQQVPHIYLTVDIQLDKLLKLRGELNAGLANRNVKLSEKDQAPPENIANQEETTNCQGNWIKASVAKDGSSYTIQVGANGQPKEFKTR